jgi:DNA-binding NtrC family response regulator
LSVNNLDTVLIVEDEDALRNLLMVMFEENGLKVLAASDGIEAIEVFTANKDKIGVVLSDIGLPRLSGWEAFLRMKEINPQVKGILASGFFENKVKEEIVKSGASNFVEKPYNLPVIISMLQDILKEVQ